MVLLDEVKRRLSELQPEVADLADALAIERSRLRLEELENKSADPAFYDDAANSGKVFAEMGEIKEQLESYRQLQELCSDAETLLEMCAEDEHGRGHGRGGPADGGHPGRKGGSRCAL